MSEESMFTTLNRKIQENLLIKGDQNGITGLLLSKRLISAHSIQNLMQSDQLAQIINWAENEQHKIGGIGRKQFGKSLEFIPKEFEQNNSNGVK